MNENSIKGFYRFSDLKQTEINCVPGCLKEQFNIVQKVPNDGVEYEFMISFYEFGEKLNARAEIFDDAFIAFETHSELFDELSTHKTITPDKVEEILLVLGYVDLEKEEAENDGK